MADSTQIRAIDATDDVDAADREAHTQLRAALLAVIAEERRAGLEIPDHHAAQIVTKALARAAPPLRIVHQRLCWGSYNKGRNYNASADEHDAPTRPVRVSTREFAAVPPPAKR